MCGCGQPTNIAKTNRPERGYRQGEPAMYVHGHWPRGRKGANANAWRGGRVVDGGYIYVHAPNHPNATSYGYVMEHRLVAEATIGRYIERGEHVHHINGIKDDNRPENLIVLKHADHARLHAVRPRRVPG